MGDTVALLNRIRNKLTKGRRKSDDIGFEIELAKNCVSPGAGLTAAAGSESSSIPLSWTSCLPYSQFL